MKDQWAYCSYADEEGFRGGIFVRAQGVVSAALEVHRLGMSPGGEMIACPVDENNLPPEKWRNRLLTKDELESICGGPGSLKTLEELENEPD